MERDDFFLIFSFVVLLMSVFFVCFSYLGFSSLLTGLAVDTGSINLTVAQRVLVNFTTTSINWGSGLVDEGEDFAVLDTVGNIYNGTWSAVSNGLNIKNSGNVNVSVNLSSGKIAETFIGGTSPFYQYNVTNVNESACIPPGGFNLEQYYDFLGSQAYRICDKFNPSSNIRLDLKIKIPSDSNLGILSDNLYISVEESE
jgi:hypothetical protein